jgi:hypothetical protein
MPAIASLEDLRAAQKDLRSTFLADSPNALPACPKPWRRQAPYALRSGGNALRGSVPLAPHDLRLTVSEMAQNRLEECM